MWPIHQEEPAVLRHAVCSERCNEGPHYYLDGGLEIDGREITPQNEAQIKQTAATIQQAGIEVVAVVGVFQLLTRKACMRRDAAESLRRLHLTSVVCSHEIGGPGLLERENASILKLLSSNSLGKPSRDFREQLRQLKLACALYVTQNDGTLADALSAAELPVKTFASGPTNSLMGAAFLQGLAQGSNNLADKQLIVVDIGGTTTDICALLPSGFPRQAPNFVEVGRRKDSFLDAGGLLDCPGGGSRIRTSDSGKTTVGPDSVAHRLIQDAMVFGGDVLTSTDIVVASGAAKLGDAAKVANLSHGLVTEAKAEIKRLLEKAVDLMKVSSAPVVVLLVGGGSILVSDKLAGVEKCFVHPITTRQML